jgi:hypothetical protein
MMRKCLVLQGPVKSCLVVTVEELLEWLVAVDRLDECTQRLAGWMPRRVAN